MSETKESSNARERIMETTTRLISERGYSEVTTILIAKEAHVSQGLLFHHFKNHATTRSVKS